MPTDTILANLARRDWLTDGPLEHGSAFERLLTGAMGNGAQQFQ